MSLVLDSLKKIKSTSQGGSSVPPSLMNLAPSGGKKGPNKALLVILGFVVIGALVIFFMPSGNDYKVQPPIPENSQTAQNTPAQQNQPNSQQAAAPQTPAQTTQANAQPAAPQQAPAVAPAQNAAQANMPAHTPSGVQPMPAPRKVAGTIVQKGQYPNMPPYPTNGQTAQPTRSLPVAEPQRAMPQIAQMPQTQQAQQYGAQDNGEAAFNAILQQAQQMQNGQIPAQNGAQAYAPSQQNYGAQAYYAAQKSNPAYTLTGAEKLAYINKINYNTLTASAANALNTGNNKKAELLYAQAMSERPNRSNLSGLLTAKIRQGQYGSVGIYLKKYAREADTGVICATATEMARLGQPQRAIALLSDYTGRAGSSQIYYTAGVINESIGKSQSAESSYAMALRSSPNDPYIVYAAARNKDVLKKYQEAVTLYKKIASMPQADDDIQQYALSRAALLTDYLSRLGN